jgi:hypothetical protein
MIYVDFAVMHLSRTCRTHHKSRRALVNSPTARRND